MTEAARSEPRDVAIPAERVGATDLLVFEATHADVHLLIGGVGRGLEWAGVVDVHAADEPLLARALAGETVRHDGELAPVVGPYQATSYAVVPGQAPGAVVVFGGPEGWTVEDAQLQAAAAEASATLHGTEPQRDLLLEMHTYDRLRALLDHGQDLSRAAGELGEMALDLLDASLAIVDPGGDAPLEVVRGHFPLADPAGLAGALAEARDRAGGGPLVVQWAPAAPLPAPLGPDQGVVAHAAVRFGHEGLLFLAHSRHHPRGFTSLDVDLIGELAGAGRVALAAAETRARLEAQRERVSWLLRRDEVTGLPDERAWLESLERTDVGAVVVVGVEVDGPPPSAKDLQVAAAVCQRSVTEDDLVARSAEAELGILLPGASEPTAREIARAITRTIEELRRRREGLPRVVCGYAAAPPQLTLERAARVAVGRMLDNSAAQHA